MTLTWGDLRIQATEGGPVLADWRTSGLVLDVLHEILVSRHRLERGLSELRHNSALVYFGEGGAMFALFTRSGQEWQVIASRSLGRFHFFIQVALINAEAKKAKYYETILGVCIDEKLRMLRERRTYHDTCDESSPVAIDCVIRVLVCPWMLLLHLAQLGGQIMLH